MRPINKGEKDFRFVYGKIGQAIYRNNIFFSFRGSFIRHR